MIVIFPRRTLAIVAALAWGWTLAAVLTGGFVSRFGEIPLSVRNGRMSALVATACLIVALAMWVYEGLSHAPGNRAASPWRSRLARVDVVAWIALAGVGIMLYQWAAARPLWLDEEMVALNLRDRRLAELAGPLWLGQGAPVGWLALQRLVVLGLGTSEHALRLVPLLFGLATLAASVWVARRWLGSVGSVVLVLLVVFGSSLSFYPFEVKPYSADAFWSLFLPALAVWAMEGDRGRSTGPEARLFLWWMVAAAGHWFSYGAVLVVPACAVVLFVARWRRDGGRAALGFAAIGTIWLASLGLHFAVSVRHTVDSRYLRNYWAFAMPPAAAGPESTLAWLWRQLAPLALKPGGTGSWRLFWPAAAVGFALATTPLLGVLFGAIPLSAFALAALRFVPLFDRLSLWIVPAVYVGIALFCSAAVRIGRSGLARRSVWRLACATVLAVVGIRICADIVWRGVVDLRLGRPPHSNHELDDRSGVGWLMERRQPGDVLVTTHLALPALWWYGGVPIAGAGVDGGRLGDGSPILEARHADGAACRPGQLHQALSGRRRALVYFGFRFDDVPDGFDELLLRDLGEFGVVTRFRHFDGIGYGAIVDLRVRPANSGVDPVRFGPPGARRRPPPGGCVVLRPAARW